MPERSDVEKRILITTLPFGEADPAPRRLLDEAGVDYVINPIGRKLKASETVELFKDFGVVIAGTEPITAETIRSAPHLKLISRVGVGLDSVDLLVAKECGVEVSYTPEAPAPAVAELTIGLMISALRSIPVADRTVRSGAWRRHMGRRLAKCTVGIVGVGRIGGRVARLLKGFGSRVVAHDIKPNLDLEYEVDLEFVDKERLLRVSDVVSLHVPMSPDTVNLIAERELMLMKSDAVIVNTARGGVVNESDLVAALKRRAIHAAAIDVFEEEPYSGPLTTLDNCILTCHMGSMSVDCRAQMEIEATSEALRFIQGRPLEQVVPEGEYNMRALSLQVDEKLKT
jgi:D-3-phosphoglycerate dehydrogenase